MQTHLTLRTLNSNQKPDRDVKALFAVEPNRTAILFIHGFGGDAISTWSDFHELLPHCPKCRGRDIFFYGYDGLRANMNGSAALFRTFLNRLFTNTDELLATSLPPAAQRTTKFKYDGLVIAAHSLGAVISRRALVDATLDHSDWPKKTRLILYAPAHMGARVADLALEAASSFTFLKLFGIAARFESPLINQLQPGSRALKTLHDDTFAATEKGANQHLIARKVIIAEYDTIVENDKFCRDPGPETIPDTTHKTICKPTNEFRQPLTMLETCL